MTILCCKSKEYMITQIQQGILYQFAFIGIVCIFLFFNKYLDYIKNNQTPVSSIKENKKIAARFPVSKIINVKKSIPQFPVSKKKKTQNQ